MPKMLKTLIAASFAGLITVVWYVFWCLIVSESPAEHGTISRYELDHIQLSIAITNHQAQVITYKSCEYLYNVNISDFY